MAVFSLLNGKQIIMKQNSVVKNWFWRIIFSILRMEHANIEEALRKIVVRVTCISNQKVLTYLRRIIWKVALKNSIFVRHIEVWHKETTINQPSVLGWKGEVMSAIRRRKALIRIAKDRQLWKPMIANVRKAFGMIWIFDTPFPPCHWEGIL